MMFMTLTHDNQSTLSSFTQFLSFVTNSPVSEKTLSGSIDVGLIESKAWHSFSRLYGHFFAASKDSFLFSQFVMGSFPVM